MGKDATKGVFFFRIGILNLFSILVIL